MCIVMQDEGQTGERNANISTRKTKSIKTAEQLFQSERGVMRVICNVRNTEIAHIRKFGRAVPTRTDTGLVPCAHTARGTAATSCLKRNVHLLLCQIRMF